jgi:CRP/FNR family transcriptional regulator, anaerobic regulatory protein
VTSLRSFYRQYPVRKVSKGQIILQQNDVPQHVYAIRSGVVKVSNITSNGAEESLSFKITNDILPVCWAFSQTTRSLFYYQAYTDCELYVVKKDDFTKQIATDHEFTQAVLARQVHAYVGNQLQVDALSKSRASTKLLYTFRYLCLSYGQEIKQGYAKILIPMTQQEFANFTGLARETVTLELTKLKDKKVVVSRAKYYTVNTDKLNGLIDDEYNPGLSPNPLK